MTENEGKLKSIPPKHQIPLFRGIPCVARFWQLHIGYGKIFDFLGLAITLPHNTYPQCYVSCTRIHICWFLPQDNFLLSRHFVDFPLPCRVHYIRFEYKCNGRNKSVLLQSTLEIFHIRTHHCVLNRRFARARDLYVRVWVNSWSRFHILFPH